MKKVLIVVMLLFSMSAYANHDRIETTRKKTSNRILSIFDPDPKVPLLQFGCCLPKNRKDFPFGDVPVGSWF